MEVWKLRVFAMQLMHCARYSSWKKSFQKMILFLFVLIQVTKFELPFEITLVTPGNLLDWLNLDAQRLAG